jgi:hypothetical protein
MQQTANLELPYILPSQAQKHVTHNEAIRSLDALVQLAVLDRDLADPPPSPVDGDRYLVAPGATGSWAAEDGKIAAWQDGAWAFLTPKAGWLVWVGDEERLIAYDGAAWIDAAVHSVNPAPLVGVNVTADATNRLAVRSPAALFDGETGDHRLKINKAIAGDTASLVFQSGYSGRAEFGLAGDDDWHVKVSADGAAWTEALKVDRATGRVTLPAALTLGDDDQVVARRHVREKLTANRTYYVRTDGSNANDGLSDNSAGAFLTIQKALDVAKALDLAGHTITVQVAAGTYTASILVDVPWLGGNVILRGDTSTPANVILSHNAYGAFTVSAGILSVEGFRIQNSAASSLGNGILVSNNAVVNISGNMTFAACTRAHMELLSGGSVNVNAGYTISGNAPNHWLLNTGNIVLSGQTITLSGAPAFSSTFLNAQNRAGATVYNATFTGSATGKRYNATLNAVINTFGGGASYFPGDVAGTTATGGQYA